MELGICEYAYLPMRANATHRAEMVSQILFGEIFEIIARHQDWAKVRLIHDNYIGWIESVTISRYLGQVPEESYITDRYVTTEDATMLIVNDNSRLFVPKGSLLPQSIVEKPEFFIGENKYFLLSDLDSPHEDTVRERLVEYAQNMIDTPYLWGGRSQWGIDCSGFAQLLYRFCGMLLPRDA
ncbi:MAG: C40 family peptidase, partial [Bacteroidales bacterium]|nr:C40 family peptidase [Bacteroidales bacterium]